MTPENIRRLAVIPARGGSKRIPRKNIRPFAGRPIIAWSIDAAVASGCFDAVVVSTDDDEIAAVAEAHGALVPFRRPAKLADDHVGMRPVLFHARDWFEERGARVEVLASILPTAPTLSAPLVREVYAALLASPHPRAFVVSEFAYPVQRGFVLQGDGSPAMLFPEHLPTRSQDLPRVYHDAGQLYVARALPGRALANEPFLGPDTLAFPIPHYRVQDIDTPDDWLRAELMVRALRETGALA